MRTLVAHEDSDYREWGASGAVRLGPGERGRGLSFSLAPTWGAASSGMERLWSARDARGLAAGPRVRGRAAPRGRARLRAGPVRRPLHGHAERRVRVLGRGARLPHRLAADLGGAGRSGLRGQPRRHAARERQRQRAGVRGRARGDAPRRDQVVTGGRTRRRPDAAGNGSGARRGNGGRRRRTVGGDADVPVRLGTLVRGGGRGGLSAGRQEALRQIAVDLYGSGRVEAVSRADDVRTPWPRACGRAATSESTPTSLRPKGASSRYAIPKAEGKPS